MSASQVKNDLPRVDASAPTSMGSRERQAWLALAPPTISNKFHDGNGDDGKHYWLTPPDVYAIPGNGTGRHIACFVLGDGGAKQPSTAEPDAVPGTDQ